MARRNLIEFEMKTNIKPMDVSAATKICFDKSMQLASRLAESYANHLKITLLRVKAFATGDTLRSVKDEFVLKSPSRYLVQTRVVASRSIVYVQLGRKPGKAPVRLAGVTDKGKKIFEPLPEFQRWLVALNIPKIFWLPIAWKIKRDGVRAREVQKRALNSAKENFQSSITAFVVDLVRAIFKPFPK